MDCSWHGVYPAATTQFNDDESLNLEATLECVQMMLDAGIHGLVMNGTVGENCSLEPDEKVQVVRETVRLVNGRVPVLTGVAEYTTGMAQRYVQQAEAAGVDGLMVLPAMVYKSDARETAQHFLSVARSTGLPVMIYNNPVSYGIDVRPEGFAALAEQSNIVAIKESSEDPRRITDLRNLYGDRFVLFCGVDDLVLESLILGAEGWISGLVNAFPEENRALWDLAMAGQWDQARSLYQWYTPLLHLDTRPKLVQYIKLAAARCGYGTETCRAPRLKLVGEERERILQIIDQALATRPQLAAQG